jgi:hypothetical protein
MTETAEAAVSTQARLRAIGKPRACPVCDGKLHALGGRRWGCEKGHTVAYAPGLLNAVGRAEPGWDEGASEALGLESVVEAPRRQTADRRPRQVGVPLLTPEEIADSKAEWERKLKRGRQRRWRARKRAGLV